MVTLSSSGYVRTMPRASSNTRQRNRYEPSDTEGEWDESPWKEETDGQNVNQGQARSKISGSRFDGVSSIPKRRQNQSTYALQREESHDHFSSLPRRHHLSSSARPLSPFSRSEQRRTPSYKTETDDAFNRKLRRAFDDVNVKKSNETSGYGRRAVSAPRKTFKERESIRNETYWEQKEAERKASPPLGRNSSSRKERDGHHKRSPTGGEINEMLANVINAKDPNPRAPYFESTDSIAPGDIFFSTDYGAVAKEKNVFAANGGTEKPGFATKANPGKRVPMNPLLNPDVSEVSMPTVTIASTAQTRTTNSKYSVSRQSSTLSEYSGRTNGTATKFAMNRRKAQSDAWFSCLKRGTCSGAKSPEKERAASYEATVIEKTFVVESLRPLWADKHQPGSLSAFSCHKQEASLLKHLATDEIPHILFKGPPGSGKKSLTMAFLREIYGESVRNISHDLRYFHIQETTPMEVVVPVTSSPHHVELNVSSEQNATYALMALVKQISADYAVIREISTVNAKAEYKVMVLYGVDKAPSNVQHLIKWIMDCYSDACKLILCCESDVDILEYVKSRCKVIDVEALDVHEIREVLIEIAKKEDIELSTSFATRVANKSKGNLRRAIMALEACKANNYPFVDDQPIPGGWEEVLVELAAGIIADPSTKRLFLVRGKIQTLLVEYVHPKLILLKLVEQLLKGVSPSSRREVYYWYAYYDKRLPPGTSALLKLEEFTAKFMSIHRRSLNHH
ncbi:OLC1v1010892C1 [Oldenlandia corymbosa var. corymbosa]|uniref:OLC1v1010892C1 n=1 Tax=Oldenlandia corymbosa var. corymbosa TaxID=529605 RepID=A0AAV1DSB7_OLDCO|nr:OLC1v1010892C1 [Oldenlandia corymbosa var. corymbosa]